MHGFSALRETVENASFLAGAAVRYLHVKRGKALQEGKAEKLLNALIELSSVKNEILKINAYILENQDTLNLSNMILKCSAVPGILLFIVIYVNDLVAFIFPIFEKNFRIRKRERFEKSLVQRKSTVKAQFSWCDLCGVCDFVCSKMSIIRSDKASVC